jgi:hypothetical protein
MTKQDRLHRIAKAGINVRDIGKHFSGQVLIAKELMAF